MATARPLVGGKNGSAWSEGRMSVSESAIGAEGGIVCRCIGARPQAHSARGTASQGERDDECADVGTPGIGAG